MFTLIEHNFNLLSSASNCNEVDAKGAKHAIHMLQPEGHQPFLALCSFDHHGGWTIIQHRLDSRENFHRSWDEYKHGFGDMFGSFYLGNDNIHALTAQGDYELMIEVTDWMDKKAHAHYAVFDITSEEDGYQMTSANYSGDAGDALAGNKVKFSTHDHDNDFELEENCAMHHEGGWWYVDCKHGNLNAGYRHQGKLKDEHDTGMQWGRWLPDQSLKTTLMKIKPIN
ncbi:hypothetical protein CAPTEDRAFT_93260 [Capitella teleta]|uniref:Fibrinogen C-terminal domain-containing protein n=1 Tax=Capitella teleta TaxID=283909 RepID=X2BBX0_CAPTE|nr:hypothetical protein CAPTEDRAFT_93260 [Capitella teleta]|eukprot:ELU10179.1 hypothetical protein CAPTEDRAFT_93260 [Capitella teleta]